MKKPQVIQVMILAGLGLAAGILATSKPRPATPTSIPAAVQPQKAGTRILHYLGKEYPLPLKTGKIVVTGSLEALEDLLELRVKPVGVMTVGGTFPALFAAITQGAIPIGEKMQPSLEAILQIQPDVIISSDKFPPATAEQLQKIAPTIPISHFPADAAANLCFLGELTGKAEQAEAILAKYRREVAAACRKALKPRRLWRRAFGWAIFWYIRDSCFLTIFFIRNWVFSHPGIFKRSEGRKSWRWKNSVKWTLIIYFCNMPPVKIRPIPKCWRNWSKTPFGVV